MKTKKISSKSVSKSFIAKKSVKKTTVSKRNIRRSVGKTFTVTASVKKQPEPILIRKVNNIDKLFTKKDIKNIVDSCMVGRYEGLIKKRRKICHKNK